MNLRNDRKILYQNMMTKKKCACQSYCIGPDNIHGLHTINSDGICIVLLCIRRVFWLEERRRIKNYKIGDRKKSSFDRKVEWGFSR